MEKKHRALQNYVLGRLHGARRQHAIMGIRTVQAVTTRSKCGEIDRDETHIVSLYHLGDAERPTWATRESVALGTMSRNRNAKQAPGRESQSPPRHKSLQTSKAPLVKILSAGLLGRLVLAFHMRSIYLYTYEVHEDSCLEEAILHNKHRQGGP